MLNYDNPLNMNLMMTSLHLSCAYALKDQKLIGQLLQHLLEEAQFINRHSKEMGRNSLPLLELLSNSS